MTQFITLTEDEFDERFPLVTNHFNPHAGWAFGEGPGCLFETFGEEFAFVRRQNPRCVWTLVDGDDGGLYLMSGLSMVNRIGYLISTLPIPDNQAFEVQLDTNQGEDL